MFIAKRNETVANIVHSFFHKQLWLEELNSTKNSKRLNKNRWIKEQAKLREIIKVINQQK